MSRHHRATRFGVATSVLAVLALGAGCGSSSSSSSSSASSSTAPASTAAASTAAAETTAAATVASTAAATGAAGASTEAAGGTLEVSADPGGALKFEQTSLTAKAGEVTIDFTNKASVPHSVAIRQGTATIGSTDVISQSTAKATVDLKPGKYTFFCTVPGHEQAGMKGTLTVQ